MWKVQLVCLMHVLLVGSLLGRMLEVSIFSVSEGARDQLDTILVVPGRGWISCFFSGWPAGMSGGRAMGGALALGMVGIPVR